jgi:S1-C subfamily serine protease
VRWLRALGVILVAALVAAAVSLGAVYLLRQNVVQPVVRGPLPQVGQADGPQTAAQRAADSVVRVETASATTATSATPSPSPPAPGGGSGAIVDSRGYILTATSVVGGAAAVSVALPGGKTQPARVVGSDPQSGLTMLRVDVTNLKALQVSGGTPLETGSGIAVMASPPGFQMAVGVVATAHTTVAIDDPAHPGQQLVVNDVAALDVASRDGQLGAPILDGGGRLVGMVIAAGAQAYGTDMADAQPGVQQLIDSGHVSYPSLGFDYRQLSTTEAADRGVPAGVDVLAVAPGSSAEQVGLSPGDIVISANGTNLDPAHPLVRQLRAMSVRQAVTLSVRTRPVTRSVSVNVALVSP